MFSAKVKSYAKINLSLNIAGTAGGYHLIDSAVCSIDIYDTVCAKPRRDALVNVYMHGRGSESIPPEKNNAVKAGEAFVSAFGTRGADIEIFKDIPVGAGLGGSSADAAGVLNALAKLYKIDAPAELKALADGLGSDTGYMLRGGFARISGRGERVDIKNTTDRPIPFARIRRACAPRSPRGILQGLPRTHTMRSGFPRARSIRNARRLWRRQGRFLLPPAP